MRRNAAFYLTPADRLLQAPDCGERPGSLPNGKGVTCGERSVWRNALVFIDGFVHQIPDIDPAETSEWLDSLDSVVDVRGKARARYLLTRLMERAREQGVGVPSAVSTPYINTIPPEQEPWFPGDEHLERRIRAFIRWNAVVMVARANRRFEGLGGHLSTYASAAALYEVGFNHFFRGKGDVGFGEMDEPESTNGLSIAARESLDNLIFVVNCNLQRLDGPVRGNGKIIQELEAIFRGAGWNVIKVVWGREWDDLLARDSDGVLVNKMNTTVDGEFQKYAVESGAYIREHFFGPDPRLRKMVEHLSDDELRKLSRGGHDYRKLFAAYKAAVEHEGTPTVILAKTIKGWTLGPDFEARNATHQIKKMTEEELKTFRDRLFLDIPDEDLEGDAMPPYFHPGIGSPEHDYLMARRRTLDGFLPLRVVRPHVLPPPTDRAFSDLLTGSGDKVQASTTTAFARLMRKLLAEPEWGKRIVPIIPDEARTFGLDGLFRDIKIYSPLGQQYEPVDAGLLLSYREAKEGRILEEGITEAGSMASATAVGTSYATWGEPMIPFYIFYSMFGFQRVGDLIWSFGDQRGRGFLLGATAGRTTLTGEGLQHADGQSHVLASSVPNCRAYDPAFAYELAVTVRDGIKRMYGDEPEDCFYYLTLYNENYTMPLMPEGVEDGILRGLYRYRGVRGERRHRAQILASGTSVRNAVIAQQFLLDEHDVAADVWSAPSYKLLREDALSVERWNRLHPTEPARTPYVTEQLGSTEGPIVAVTDFMKAVPDQVARFVPQPFVSLGTDGYGFSDTREALRRHFEVDAAHIVVATLSSLARQGDVKDEAVAEAIQRYGIDPETVDPRLA